MAINGETPLKQGTSNKGSGKGYYVNELVVESVEEQTPTWSDASIRVIAIDPSNDYRYNLFMNSKFEKDNQNGKVIGWAFPEIIHRFFKACDVPVDVSDNGTMDTKAINTCEGKRFLAIRYRSNGKYKYNTWNKVNSLNDGAASLEAEFKMGLEDGFPKDFDKNPIESLSNGVVSEEDNTDFPFGNAKEEATVQL